MKERMEALVKEWEAKRPTDPTAMLVWLNAAAELRDALHPFTFCQCCGWRLPTCKCKVAQ